jgi:hypothetical protein
LDRILDFTTNMVKTFNQASPQGKKTILQSFGSNLTLKDKRIDIKPRSIFSFLKDYENELKGELGVIEPTISLLKQANQVNQNSQSQDVLVVGLEPTRPEANGF